MTRGSIHGEAPVYSAQNVLEALGRALSEIKSQDRLTYADLGAVLGKSEDQAAKYCDGSATMDAVTLGRGEREWGSRLTGYYDRLIANSRPKGSDHCVVTALAEATAKLAKALEDGRITAEEVRTHRSTLETARDEIDNQLGKLRPAA